MDVSYRFLANETLGMFVVMFAVLNVDGQMVAVVVVVVVVVFVVVVVGLLGIL